MLADKLNDEKFINSSITLLYRYLWIPCRILLYIVTVIHITFVVNLLSENTDDLYDPTLKSAWMCFYTFCAFKFELLIHILIYKTKVEHVTKPVFPPLEKRFSKEELKQLKPGLKELLSHSHKTEEDLKVFLKEKNREAEMKF